MPAYGVSVKSQITFRGQPHMTTRVYHYRITAPTESDWNNLADAVVAQDRLGNSNVHAYKEVRVWGPTEGPKSDNLMRLVKDLTGSGSWAAGGPQIYPELCYYVTMYIGRDETTNRKLFLKKFIHPMYWKSNTGVTSAGIEPVPAADATFFKNWFEGCKTVTANAVSFTLVSPRNVATKLTDVANTGPRLHVRQLTQ